MPMKTDLKLVVLNIGKFEP